MNLDDYVGSLILDYFSTPEGEEHLIRIGNEAIDEYLTEHPDQTRDQVIQRLKSN